MNTQIVITEFHLRAAMRHLLRDPAHPLVCPAGLNRLDNETEWLVRGVGVPANLEARQPCVILTAQSLSAQPDSIWLGNRMVAVVHLPREGAPAVQLLIPDGGAEAGNLLRLNLIAAGLGLRMVEDYLARRLRGPQWIRLEYTAGVPSIQVLFAPVCTGQALCALCGAGDEGLLAHSRPAV